MRAWLILHPAAGGCLVVLGLFAMTTVLFIGWFIAGKKLCDFRGDPK